MSFFERDNELRRMHLLRDIAIAEAEEQAIKETLKDRQNEEAKEQIKIVDRNAMPLVPEDKPVKPQETKQDRDPNAKPWVPKDPPIEPQETKQEIKFKVNPDATPYVPKAQPLEPQEIEPQEPREIRAQDENTTIFKELLSLQEKQSELSSMLVKQNQLNNLPVKEPPVFSGDPFDYPAFITAFD